MSKKNQTQNKVFEDQINRDLEGLKTVDPSVFGNRNLNQDPVVSGNLNAFKNSDQNFFKKHSKDTETKSSHLNNALKKNGSRQKNGKRDILNSLASGIKGVTKSIGKAFELNENQRRVLNNTYVGPGGAHYFDPNNPPELSDPQKAYIGAGKDVVLDAVGKIATATTIAKGATIGGGFAAGMAGAAFVGLAAGVGVAANEVHKQSNKSWADKELGLSALEVGIKAGYAGAYKLNHELNKEAKEKLDIRGYLAGDTKEQKKEGFVVMDLESVDTSIENAKKKFQYDKTLSKIGTGMKAFGIASTVTQLAVGNADMIKGVSELSPDVEGIFETPKVLGEIGNVSDISDTVKIAKDTGQAVIEKAIDAFERNDVAIKNPKFVDEYNLIKALESSKGVINEINSDKAYFDIERRPLQEVKDYSIGDSMYYETLKLKGENQALAESINMYNEAKERGTLTIERKKEINKHYYDHSQEYQKHLFINDVVAREYLHGTGGPEYKVKLSNDILKDGINYYRNSDMNTYLSRKARDGMDGLITEKVKSNSNNNSQGNFGYGGKGSSTIKTNVNSR